MRLIVDLTLPTEARLISRTRQMVAGYLQELGVDAETTDDVVLAMDEACTNVMRHAFPADGNDTFHLTAELGPDEVVVVVEDCGPGLPLMARTDQAADPTATSGRGLYMIRQLMTDVAVETAPLRQGTRLEMRKALPIGFGTD
jgi:serine/threonine-protein kinase RsbW